MRTLECVGVADRHNTTANRRSVAGFRRIADLHVGAVALGVSKTNRELGFFGELERGRDAEQPVITPGLRLRSRAFDEIVGEVGAVGRSEVELGAKVFERQGISRGDLKGRTIEDEIVVDLRREFHAGDRVIYRQAGLKRELIETVGLVGRRIAVEGDAGHEAQRIRGYRGVRSVEIEFRVRLTYDLVLDRSIGPDARGQITITQLNGRLERGPTEALAAEHVLRHERRRDRHGDARSSWRGRRCGLSAQRERTQGESTEECEG